MDLFRLRPDFERAYTAVAMRSPSMHPSSDDDEGQLLTLMRDQGCAPP